MIYMIRRNNSSRELSSPFVMAQTWIMENWALDYKAEMEKAFVIQKYF